MKKNCERLSTGGFGRAANLSPERRREIGQLGASVRWGKERSICHPAQAAYQGTLCFPCFEKTHRAYVKGKMNASVVAWFERDILKLGGQREDVPTAPPKPPPELLAKFSVDSKLPGTPTKDPTKSHVQMVEPPRPAVGSVKATFLAWVMLTLPHGHGLPRRDYFEHECSWGIPTSSRRGRYVCAHGFNSEGEKIQEPS